MSLDEDLADRESGCGGDDACSDDECYFLSLFILNINYKLIDYYFNYDFLIDMTVGFWISPGYQL